MKFFFVAMFVVSALSITYAAEPDARLATVRKAFVVAVDELDADRPVSICFAERLAKMTPIEPVKAKEDADVIFRIKAHGTKNFEPVPAPRRPTTAADIVAQNSLTGPYSGQRQYYHGSEIQPEGIECLLADDLLNTLRDAMKKARDATK